MTHLALNRSVDMKCRLVAIGRLPDGRLVILDSDEGRYEVTEDSAWDDLNAIVDDPALSEPEPVQAAVAGVSSNGVEGVRFAEQLATEIYGPLAGALTRNAGMGVIHLLRKMTG